MYLDLNTNWHRQLQNRYPPRSPSPEPSLTDNRKTTETVFWPRNALSLSCKLRHYFLCWTSHSIMVMTPQFHFRMCCFGHCGHFITPSFAFTSGCGHIHLRCIIRDSPVVHAASTVERINLLASADSVINKAFKISQPFLHFYFSVVISWPFFARLSTRQGQVTPHRWSAPAVTTMNDYQYRSWLWCWSSSAECKQSDEKRKYEMLHDKICKAVIGTIDGDFNIIWIHEGLDALWSKVSLE